MGQATERFSRQVPGLAVVTIVFGIVLIYSAIKNTTVSATIRALIKGETPTPQPSKLDALRDESATWVDPAISAGAGSGLGAEIAASARAYVGKVAYKWAGEDPSGWDCSGFVTYVLHTEHGLELPDNTHTTAAGFYTWTGAVTVPRDQCQAGDLVCWVTHVGIATSQSTMVDAPHPGALTREEGIWSAPTPIIRRPKAYTTARAGEAPQRGKVAP